MPFYVLFQGISLQSLNNFFHCVVFRNKRTGGLSSRKKSLNLHRKISCEERVMWLWIRRKLKWFMNLKRQCEKACSSSAKLKVSHGFYFDCLLLNKYINTLKTPKPQDSGACLLVLWLPDTITDIPMGEERGMLNCKPNFFGELQFEGNTLLFSALP